MEEKYQRKDDEIVARIDQQLYDFIAITHEWQKKHDFEAREFRNEIKAQLKELTDFRNKLDTPYKVGLWVLGLIVASISGGIGLKIFRWLDR